MNYFVITVFVTLAFVSGNLSTPTNGRFVAETDVILNLFTRNNPTTAQILKNGDLENLKASNFQLDKPLKIFTHGWIKSAESPETASSFLAAGDYNVIIVDWTKGAVSVESEMVANVPFVGNFVASFIDWVSTLGLPHSKVHIVGVSVGSHVAAASSRSCKLGVVEVVTGCDPSKKFWEGTANNISPKDAKYVELIHTNTAQHGLIYPAGTADFYPNGGAHNPGCSDNLCDHGRSHNFFLDSLDHQKFVSQKCNSYDEVVNGTCANIGTSYMGGTGVAKNISGVYYLTTNAEKPYYKG